MAEMPKMLVTIDASAVDAVSRSIAARILREVADSFYHPNGNLRASSLAGSRLRAKAAELLGEPVVNDSALSEKWTTS